MRRLSKSTAATLAIPTLALGLVTACSSSSGGAAGGSNYPTRSITYISPFPPGGGTDLLARREQPYLQKLLGHDVIITAVSGGSGAVGWTQTAKAQPDGYTMGVMSLPNIVVQPLAGDSGYQTDDLVPIGLNIATPLVLAVPLDSPYQTLKQFLDAAKAKPGKVTVGGSGSLTSVNLATLAIEKAADVKLQYVSYNGGAQQVAAFLGKHVDSVVFNASDILPYLSKAKILGITTAESSPVLPDAPTFTSQGVNLVQLTEYGAAVPKGTPQNVIDRLQTAFTATSKDPTFAADTLKAGSVAISMSHDEAVAEINKEKQTFGDLIAWAKQNKLLSS
jgi:tripartite-type tricarboxylate transporter receptor subunit TctC